MFCKIVPRIPVNGSGIIGSYIIIEKWKGIILFKLLSDIIYPLPPGVDRNHSRSFSGRSHKRIPL